ncbi:hypothetical protein SPBR_05302 [Sporothrix brasiliensis 5110]|uniref:Uncharacterized protein n=1 Tax=Sporothrix brasiliensis 5110 TaxID=1398154 RepID=A0A0C2ELQ3_9PEZI|nr:uncharacterized protein SPBR_05302 [Sporothrix brasiliensis 5110]KIH87049.1 hypothetical protein SPBR_05302 [Sporothrix brasiliensis 5110]
MHGGDSDSAAIVHQFNGRLMCISVTDGDPLSNAGLQLSPDSRLIHLINQTMADDVNANPGSYEKLEDEILDMVLAVGRALSRQVAPLAPSQTTSSDSDRTALHALLYPEQHHFNYQVDRKARHLPHGWTRDWADADLAETMEGDKQAVVKIRSAMGGRRARHLALKAELPSTTQALHCVVSTASRAYFKSDVRAVHDALVRVCISSIVDLRPLIGIDRNGHERFTFTS